MQTAHADLHLRPENGAALAYSSLVSPATELLCLDDVPEWLPLASTVSYVLVDHNRLLDGFGGEKGRVVAVVDHHADEHVHEDATVKPRLIEPVGSCSSLVVDYFASHFPSVPFPSELAQLLLSALLIDTNLKPVAEGGKATAVDISSATFLVDKISAGISAFGAGGDTLSKMLERNQELGVRKSDIGGMAGRDLLRRDYKEYHHQGIMYGLSTVPIPMARWLEQSGGDWTPVEAELNSWMEERSLALLGVLTTYKTANKPNGKKGKHARELLLRIIDPALSTVPASLEASPVLQLELLKTGGDYTLYQQGNDKATRKQVAPLLLEILTTLLGPAVAE